jgi:hypothetical protein
VTVLPIEKSSSPARWVLSAAGRKEMSVLSQTQQVIINVPFDVSRSDALAVSAHAPGVIVVAGARTRAKDLDEALALLNAVSPQRLVAIITEHHRSRNLWARLARPRRKAKSHGLSSRPVTAVARDVTPPEAAPTPVAPEQPTSDQVASPQH